MSLNNIINQVQPSKTIKDSVYCKEVWNAAIEAAALSAEKYEAYAIAYEIRTLKK